MKEFNLEAALNGEPVMLRNGNKALILYQSPNNLKYANGGRLTYFLRGVMFNKDGNVVDSSVVWRIDGKYSFISSTGLDIIGMWEEPKLTSEQVLEKAYQENLPLDAIGKKAFVIAKTKDGDYVMQCGEDNLYFASNEIEWKFYKDPVPKSDTITVTLPKPFKPKSGDGYYYINEYGVQFARWYDEDDDIDVGLAENAQCYRTREDAQKWLDFMKSMTE
jgi:hypothetical protein|nr:MAG TPA: hypothetical protein [Caudoviricetes sp.]